MRQSKGEVKNLNFTFLKEKSSNLFPEDENFQFKAFDLDKKKVS